MFNPKRFLSLFVLMFFVCGFVCMAEADPGIFDDSPVAEVMIGSSGVNFMPKVNYAQLVITVARADGSVFERTFESGSTPYLDLSSIFTDASCDGTYNYELRVVPTVSPRSRDSVERAGLDKDAIRFPRALRQTGSFSVQNGAIVPPSGAQEGLSRTMDILHYDDVIITGSLCIGFDCVNGESFGYDTLKLKENNLRMYFEDTSAGSFPSGDWRIRINDTTSGGASYFAIEDGTNGRTPFRIETGAPTHSLYVEDYGRVGLGTSIPYVELHIVDGDSPTIRLDQDGSSGWTAQRWDLCGNETNFFIRDVTNGSKLCFRIQPNTPSSTLNLKSNGYVGIGTWSPEYPLELETTGENAEFLLERTSGARAQMGASSSLVYFGARSDSEVRFQVNSDWRMRLNPTANSRILQINDGVSGTSGPYADASGWFDNSSRELKENINSLTGDEALEALNGLNPVKYNYKQNKADKRVGFIAEDVPELVAVNGRKHLKSMDIVAVLTKVVQEQQKFIREQQKINAQLKKKIAELEKK
jgi:hypothetical protein